MNRPLVIDFLLASVLWLVVGFLVEFIMSGPDFERAEILNAIHRWGLLSTGLAFGMFHPRRRGKG